MQLQAYQGRLWPAAPVPLSPCWYPAPACVCVLQVLLRETGRSPSADLTRTSEVSLTALLDACGFHHPVWTTDSL